MKKTGWQLTLFMLVGFGNSIALPNLEIITDKFGRSPPKVEKSNFRIPWSRDNLEFPLSGKCFLVDSVTGTMRIQFEVPELDTTFDLSEDDVSFRYQCYDSIGNLVYLDENQEPSKTNTWSWSDSQQLLTVIDDGQEIFMYLFDSSSYYILDQVDGDYTREDEFGAYLISYRDVQYYLLETQIDTTTGIISKSAFEDIKISRIGNSILFRKKSGILNLPLSRIYLLNTLGQKVEELSQKNGVLKVDGSQLKGGFYFLKYDRKTYKIYLP